MTPPSDNAHPKDRFALDGVDAPAAAVEDALRRGRLHHAWLLVGPEGMGKASFAFRVARRLLGAKVDASFGPLGAAPDDPVSRLIAAEAHPDLLVLEKSGDGARKTIPVDAARRLPEFFAKAPARGAHRVAVIDAVDDLNSNGANAILKTLEEPTARGVLLLVSHAPGRLLPTIRSRCRTLAFRPWSEDAIGAWLAAQTSIGEADAKALGSLSKGSPGRAMALMRADVAQIDKMAQDVVDGALSTAALAAVADGFRGAEGSTKFELVLGRLASAAYRQAQAPWRGAGEAAGGGSAARWAGLWERLTALPGRVEGLNLDRADAFWSAVTDIAETRCAC